MGGLISSRQVAIIGTGRGAYGLEMERAWNFGLSLTQGFKFRYRDASLNVDLHHTRFNNQVVVDYDYSPQQLLFYNLQGQSYSTSFQTELDLKPARRLDVRLAYRWLDVKTQYQTGFFTRPLVAKHRVFMNVAYETRSKWMFDYTVSRIGTKRLPDTRSNPEGLRFPEQSPAYWIMNGQVTKRFKRWDVYVGVENLADFRQTQLINAADQPFSPFFDASMIWGPAIERMVYVGFRYRIPSSTE
jgi:outer membrane receptor protein involved in Fe transport